MKIKTKEKLIVNKFLRKPVQNLMILIINQSLLKEIHFLNTYDTT